MQRARVKLLAIIFSALVFRLLLMSLVQNPGINDSVHYFNLGRRLLQGQGLTIDYVWHYSRMPAELAQPIDHWMPLAGIAAAFGMAAGGANIHAALTLFVMAGSFMPLLAYWSAKQLELPESTALTAALLAAFLPDLVWNSLHTDTTILNALLAGGAILLVNEGLIAQRHLAFFGGGLLVGLAYLTRNDSILLLPVIIAQLWLARAWVPGRRIGQGAALLALGCGLVVGPWLLRNVMELGSLGSSNLTAKMPFMLTSIDFYAYRFPITWESMLERSTALELVSLRLYQLAAAIKQMAVSLDLPLVALLPAGFALLMKQSGKRGLAKVFPLLIWLGLIVIAYPLVLPIMSKNGSFEKAFLTILPLLTPFGAIGLYGLIRPARLRRAVLAASVLWLACNSYSLLKSETELADRYHQSIKILVDALADMPDTNGDGKKILMAQDPYVLSFFGYPSIMVPLASRADTLELAQLYGVDYLMMPTGRPALDPLYLSQEQDTRFELAAHLADAGEKPFELFRLRPEA